MTRSYASDDDRPVTITSYIVYVYAYVYNTNTHLYYES